MRTALIVVAAFVSAVGLALVNVEHVTGPDQAPALVRNVAEVPLEEVFAECTGSLNEFAKRLDAYRAFAEPQASTDTAAILLKRTIDALAREIRGKKCSRVFPSMLTDERLLLYYEESDYIESFEPIPTIRA